MAKQDWHFSSQRQLHKHSLTTKQKLERALRYTLLSRPPMANIKNPNLVVPYAQMPNVAENGPLKHVVLLEKGEPGIHEISTEEVAKKVLATIRADQLTTFRKVV